MTGLIIFVLLCALVAWWARRKGRSALAWFLLSLLLSPVITAIIMLFLKNLRAQARPRSGRDRFQPRGWICPSCGQESQPQANYCSSCGQKRGQPPPGPRPNEPGSGRRGD